MITYEPTDYKEFKDQGFYNGACALTYREPSDTEVDCSRTGFICNSTGDGWFRKDEGIAKGYGLAIKSMRVTASPKHWGSATMMVKVKVTHIDDRTEETVSSLFWLTYHNNVTLESITDYIFENSMNWRP